MPSPIRRGLHQEDTIPSLVYANKLYNTLVYLNVHGCLAELVRTIFLYSGITICVCCSHPRVIH